MIRPLSEGDTARALALLRQRPLENIFLEYVIRTGALGRVPGFYGCEQGGRLVAVFMIGPQGGTSLAVTESSAYRELAELARDLTPRPRHIVGPEDTTDPFWEAYAPHADPLVWARREPVYSIDRAQFRAAFGDDVPTGIGPAPESDADAVVANSARQHIEDLGDDRFGADPEGFRRRHLADVRDGRWWVLRERRRICFQVHVGPENDHAIQIGGVITPADLRKRGYATRGVAATVARLLERRPSVVLFCGEDNHAARRVYERVGFRVALYYRSYLLSEPTPCPSEYA